MKCNLFLMLSVCGAMAFASYRTNAELVAYEGFDYTDLGTTAGSDPLGGLNGGTGWEGAWSASDDGTGDNSYEIQAGSLGVSTLPTTGNYINRVGTNNRAIASRSLTEAAQDELFADNTTMWFSLVLTSGGSGEDFAFIIGDSAHSFPSSAGADPGIDGSQAFGVALIAGRVHASYYNSTGTQTLSSENTTPGSGTKLIVGQIDWLEPNYNGSTNFVDTLRLYHVTDVDAPLPTAFATLTRDFDQAGDAGGDSFQFDLISIWDRPGQQTGVDEIRLGTSLEAVLGVPEPSSLALLGLGGLLLTRRRRG